MSTLSHSSTASQAAEALLNRARRLSSNAYERTRPPTTFAEGEDSNHLHISHYDAFRPRSSNMPILLHRSSTRPSSLSNPLSTTTTSATSATHTTITSTPIIVSDAEGISSSTADQTLSQVPTPEGPNNTTSSTHNNTFLDPSRAHTLLCTTSTLSSQSTRLTSLSAAGSRPRALTLEAFREVRDPEDESTSDSKSLKDQHRKHRSENGGSLVRDILAALRQHTELESPMFNHQHTTDLTNNPDHGNNSSLPSSMSPEQKRQQHSIQTAVEECELDGRNSPASIKSALSPNQQIALPLKAEMASKSNSDLTTSLKHVPASDVDKSQTTVGEPSPEATLPPGLPGYGIHSDGASSADETREIESTTTIITPDHTSALSSDYSSEEEDSLVTSAQEKEKEAIALSASEPLSSSLTAAEPLKPTKTSIFPSTSTGSMLEREPSRKEGKESKGAFLLHRIGVRKNSFTESAPPSSVTAAALSPMDSSDTSSIRSQSTQRSTGSVSSVPQHKLSKRSTKLLGKFVPKFLQTSFSPSLSTPGNNTSPRLQAIGVSPLSARSSLSGSISGQNHSPTNKTFSAEETRTEGSSAPSSNKCSRESLVLDTTYDTDSLSPGYTHMDATSPQYLEFLRSDTHITPSFKARRSSCSSATSKMSGNSFESKPSASSVSSFDPSENTEFRRHSGGAKGGDSMCAFEVDYDEEDVEEDKEVEEIAAAAAAAATMNTDETVNDVYDPPLSPYIIDEDCDDDFFLNSVLRKKSNPSMTSDYHEQYQRGFTPVMMSSYPSGTTMSSIHSSATTPSLSGWSSTSSQASTPPTSPLLLNGQVYPFPVTSPPSAATSAMCANSSSNTTMHVHHRSNPLPPPIKIGLDEKRSRLRDAVGEWRRSANTSN